MVLTSSFCYRERDRHHSEGLVSGNSQPERMRSIILFTSGSEIGSGYSKEPLSVMMRRVLRVESYNTWQVLQWARWASSCSRISAATSLSRRFPSSVIKSWQVIIRSLPRQFLQNKKPSIRAASNVHEARVLSTQGSSTQEHSPLLQSGALPNPSASTRLD